MASYPKLKVIHIETNYARRIFAATQIVFEMADATGDVKYWFRGCRERRGKCQLRKVPGLTESKNKMVPDNSIIVKSPQIRQITI